MNISVAKAKDTFSSCLSKAQAGESVMIEKHGHPIAQIIGIPAPSTKTVQFDCGRGTVKVLADLHEPAIALDDWETL